MLDVDVDRALVALARTAGQPDKEGGEAFFSRDIVSNLEQDVVQRWGERPLVGVKALIDRLNNPAMARSTEGRLKVLLEMLSRLLVRRPELAGPAIDPGLALHGHREFRHVLEKPLEGLFRRAFKVLPDDLVPLYRRRLFETRIPATTNGYYKDPAQAASDAEGLEPGDPAFDGIIARTTAAIRDAELRYAAVMQLHWLHESDALTPAQIDAYAAALWDDRFVEEGLPTGTPLWPWAFSLLPHPAGSDPASVAKARILALKDLDGENALGILNGLVSSSPTGIVLSARELKPFIEMLLASAAPEAPDEPRSRLPMFFRKERLNWNFWQAFDRLFGLATKYASLRALVTTYYAGTPRLEAARSVVIALEARIITPAFAKDLLLRAWGGDERQALAAAFASIRWAKAKPQGKPLPAAVWSLATDSVIAIDEYSVLAGLEFFRGAYATVPKAVPGRLDARLERALLAVLARTGRPDVRTTLPVDPGAVRYAGARLVAAIDRAGRAPKGLLDRSRDEASREGVGEIRGGLRREGEG